MRKAELDEPVPNCVGPVVSRSGTTGGAEILVSSTRPWTTVLSLVGSHDVTVSTSFERSALEHLDRCDRLVVDLSQADFVDSSVISALVRVAQQARPRGVIFQVVAPCETHVHRVLDLMGLLNHLGCRDGLPEMQAARPAEQPPTESPHPAAPHGTETRAG